MKAIASGNVVARDDIDIALPLHANPGTTPPEVVQRNLATFKTQITTVAQTASKQVLHNFLLAIDRHGLSREFDEGNAMKLATQTQFDSLVTEALALQALGDARVAQHFDACVLQNPCAHALLAIGALPCFQHDRCDAMLMEQMREHQAGRSCADDSDLGFKLCHYCLCYFCFSRSFRTSLAAWKAPLAAGTPQ